MSTDAIVLCCASCLARNRVPRARLGDVPVCSTCRAHLLPAHPLALTTAGFDRFVGGSELPIVVDFWAPWCGPCRMMAPHYERVAAALLGKAVFAKVDTEQEPALAARHAIQGIPSLLVFRGGREVARHTGALTEGPLTAWVQQQL